MQHRRGNSVPICKKRTVLKEASKNNLGQMGTYSAVAARHSGSKTISVCLIIAVNRVGKHGKRDTQTKIERYISWTTMESS